MKNRMGKTTLIALFVGTMFLTVLNAKPGGGEKGEPPKEAIEICVGKSSGSECTMNTPRGSLSGTCMNTTDEKYFVCMPEGGPKGGH